MFKESVMDPYVEILLNYIYQTIMIKPGQWYNFINKIIGCKKYTHFADTTMIISVYEMSVHQVVILYNVLKQFKNLKIAKKVINKKEFVIVHLASPLIVRYLENAKKWLGYMLYREISSLFPQIVCEYFPSFSDNDLIVNVNKHMYCISYHPFEQLGNIYEINIVKVNKCEKWPVGMVKFAYNRATFQKNIKTFFKSVLITC